jgi:hypothetical protein
MAALDRKHYSPPRKRLFDSRRVCWRRQIVWRERKEGKKKKKERKHLRPTLNALQSGIYRSRLNVRFSVRFRKRFRLRFAATKGNLQWNFGSIFSSVVFTNGFNGCMIKNRNSKPFVCKYCMKSSAESVRDWTQFALIEISNYKRIVRKTFWSETLFLWCVCCFILHCACASVHPCPPGQVNCHSR